MHLLPARGAPLATGSLLYRPGPKGWRLVVVAKQTYALRPERCELADRADSLVAKERSYDGSARGSIRAPIDLVPFKPRPEYVVVGSAFPPADHETDELVVAATVAGIRKALRLRAPQRRGAGSGDGAGSNGSRWPLRWELAAKSEDNPVGVSPSGKPSIRLLAGHDGAAGLGPLSSRWPVRRRRLGDLASRWSDDSLQWTVLDEQFDGHYFQAASEDQWLDEIPADLPLVLEHLHPDHQRLETRLDGPAPRARVRRAHGTYEPIVLQADTVVVDSDRAVVSVTWRGHVELGGPDEDGVVQFGRETAQGVEWLEGSAEEDADTEGDTTATVRLPGDPPQTDAPTLSLDLDGATADALPPPRPSEPAWLAPQRPAAKAPRPAPRRSAPPPPPRRPAPSEVPSPRSAAPSEVPPPRPSAPSEVPPPRPSAPSEVPSSSVPRASRPPAGAPLVRPPNPIRDLYARRPASERPAAVPAPSREPDVVAPNAAVASLVELVWHGDRAAAVVRKDETLKKLLPPTPEPPPRPKPRRGEVPAPPPPPPDPEDEADEARRDVAVVLAEAQPVPQASLPGRLAAALDGDERQPPLVVVRGSLELLFDDVEALGITCRLAKPVAVHDKPLAEAVAMADEAAEALADAPPLTRPLRERVAAAWRKANRELPADYLDRGVQRALLEKRAYRTIQLLGGDYLIGMLPAADRPLPVYLPAEAALCLPMYASFDAQLLARVVTRQDEAEPNPIALSVLAVGRRVALKPA